MFAHQHKIVCSHGCQHICAHEPVSVSPLAAGSSPRLVAIPCPEDAAPQGPAAVEAAAPVQLQSATATEPAAPRTRRRRFARGTAPHPNIDVASSTASERDLQLASQFQRSFLPRIPETLNGVRMLAEYHPAFEVGGDFYDLIHIDEDRFVVIMGDVSGKGVSAALIMSRLVSEFRVAAHRGLRPDEILAEVNNFVTSIDFDLCFVTATVVEVSVSNRTIAIANAGHVPAIARREDGGMVAMFGDASGAPLGLLDGEQYRCDTHRFQTGDIVLLVTDGITEVLEPFADPAAGVLTGIVANTEHDIGTLKQTILGAVDDSDPPGMHDDVALFAMQFS